MAAKDAPTLKVIKGKALPLNAAQHELVAIFIEYLRRLPPAEIDDKGSMENWASGEYSILNRLLTNHFLADNPAWKVRANGGRKIDDLPDNECDRYERLMRNAAAVDDVANRRRAFLQLARDKKWVYEFAGRYERDRKELGLEPEHLLAPRPATPLEIAAQTSYEENHLQP